MFYSEAQVDEGMSFGIKMSSVREYYQFTYGSPGMDVLFRRRTAK